MSRRVATALILAALPIASGCIAMRADTRTQVNTAIPAEVQQDIRTAADQEVDFEFVPAPNADEIEVRFRHANKASYPLNAPMASMYRELIESKFARINPNSPNKIRVELLDVQSQTASGWQYTVQMTAKVTTTHNGTTNSRDMTYSQTMEAQDRGNLSFSLPQRDLQDFMVKFIVATDRYIDANFGIR